MKRPAIEELSFSQQTVLTCIQTMPGIYTRSALAKMLVGSKSSRVAEFTSQPYYGCLSDYGRKEITFEMDILLQQGYLEINGGGKIVMAPIADLGRNQAIK
jgi:uncharacterized protein YpbB